MSSALPATRNKARAPHTQCFFLGLDRLEVDVCVVGGGSAGLGAAIAAARSGAATVLIHGRSMRP